MTRTTDIMKIADHYDLHHQLGKPLEELGELKEPVLAACVESAHVPSLSEYVTERLVDELADVAIMIEQIAYLARVQPAVRNRIDFKIDRQLGRMREETE